MKQKLLAVLLVLSGLLAMTACGEDSDGDFNLNRQINVIARESGSGTHQAFIEILGIEVRGTDGSVRDMTTIDAEIAQSTSAVIQSVAGNHFSIGYISLGSLNDSVSAVSVDGVLPTAENVQNGTYPLFRTFYIAVQHEPDPLTQEFINFILSAEGQALAADGYVPADSSAAPYVSSGTFSGTVVVSGSTSVLRLMGRLEEAFEAIHPDVNVEVHAGGTSAGINAAISGTAQIGMSSRELRPNELETLNAVAIAYDGLAVIVNSYNPLPNLTSEQIRQVFVGDIGSWGGLVD